MNSEVPYFCKDTYFKDLWKLAAYVKERTLQRLPVTLYPNQREIPPSPPKGSVGLDTAIDMFPRDVAERLDRALINLVAVTKHLGQTINVGTEGEEPLFFAQNPSEILFVLQQLHHEGYLDGRMSGLPAHAVVMAKGLNRVADLRRGLLGPSNKQVFVAMSFDPSLDDAWANGLKRGIEDCGFTALRVDAKEHNEKICDVIVAEIRKSKFLVADFTGHRNGVYFEAGLMMGLGRPVIFTRRKDELDKAHFDTRQYNHIEWETPAELRKNLKRRIQATIAV